MKNNKQVIALMLIVVGTGVAAFLSHGMNVFYNFLILPLVGLITYLGFKKQWPVVMLGVFLVTVIWQFIAMGSDGMFEQKMYLETISGALSMGFIYISLSMVGVALGALFTYAFTKISDVSKWKRLFRSVSGLIGIILIVGLASLTNAFIGNPVSASLATNSAQNYARENFSDLDLKVERASYNFKFDHYMVRVSSEKSKDTYFAIYLDSFGHVLEDDYKGNVLSGWNTYRRINEEFDAYTESIIRKQLPYEYDMLIGQLDDREPSAMKNLKRDMDYDLSALPLKGLVTVYVYADDLSWKNVAKVTLELNQVLEAAHIDVAEYTVVLEAKKDESGKRGDSIGIYDFPKEKLELPNLEKEMALFFEAWNKKSK